MPSMAETLYSPRCLLCRAPLASEPKAAAGGSKRVECRNCGDHTFSRECLDDLPKFTHDVHTRACVAHRIRNVPAESVITTAVICESCKNPHLPYAMERIDNLLLYLAASYAPGERVNLDSAFMRAALGAETPSAAQWVIEQAQKLEFIDGDSPHFGGTDRSWVLLRVALTIQGWQRHAELMRDGAGSRHAFMAMDFNEVELQTFFTQHLQPAVSKTGFELRTTNHPGKTAGVIDNRMRVELRTSRFVVCDLSHGNHGAYWEAGFAEGIGRPVFYICQRDTFASTDRHTRPHFDTAHQPIIQWSLEDPDKAVAELKNMIRATLPAEAKMEDTPGV